MRDIALQVVAATMSENPEACRNRSDLYYAQIVEISSKTRRTGADPSRRAVKKSLLALTTPVSRGETAWLCDGVAIRRRESSRPAVENKDAPPLKLIDIFAPDAQGVWMGKA